MVIVVPCEKNSIGGEIDARGELLDAAQHAERRIGRRGRDLFDGEGAVGEIEQDEVRVGAADIDPQPITLHEHQCDASKRTAQS